MMNFNQFKQKTTSERIAVIKANNKCGLCFEGGHGARECVRNIKCYKCSKKHNSLLHFFTKTNEHNSRTKAREERCEHGHMQEGDDGDNKQVTAGDCR